MPHTSLISLQRLPNCLDPHDPRRMTFNLYESALSSDLDPYSVGDFVLIAGLPGDHSTKPIVARVLEIVQVIGFMEGPNNLAHGVLVDAFDSTQIAPRYRLPLLKQNNSMMVSPNVSFLLFIPLY